MGTKQFRSNSCHVGERHFLMAGRVRRRTMDEHDKIVNTIKDFCYCRGERPAYVLESLLQHALSGAYFGYPICCILHFLEKCILDDARKLDKKLSKVDERVLCPACAKTEEFFER
jgi:hypothetical protein